ncbi:PucR family transcriptional regulator [Streptomyces sp. NPDC058092]|uniref:PucR family transcriptional regulator n=1 Tax=Streptomyces sp. NPDC058092 TaxID=3346336 RepID=UPI0036EB87B8
MTADQPGTVARGQLPYRGPVTARYGPLVGTRRGGGRDEHGGGAERRRRQPAQQPVPQAATPVVRHPVPLPVRRRRFRPPWPVTTETVGLVARTGHPPGLYRLADVLLEYQLSRPSEALRGLARLLKPLNSKPELPHTLETHLELGLDRRSTAAALHIHPNTVDCRIRRIDRLTGLSPARPADSSTSARRWPPVVRRDPRGNSGEGDRWSGQR